MKLPRRKFLHLTAGAAALPAVSRVAWAQAYPTRPVRIIVEQAAGSGSDTAARLIGQFLSERLGQQFVIENRPGAGGNIATEAVVRSPPDGYTLLLLNSSNLMRARPTLIHEGQHLWSPHIAFLNMLDAKSGSLDEIFDRTIEMTAAG
jgi:tripartite-type tricarboxylate transporter receptor subunit TctC